MMLCLWLQADDLTRWLPSPLLEHPSNHKLLKSINKLCKFWRAIIVIKIGQMALCWFIASSRMSFGWLRPNGLSQPKDIQASAKNHHKAICPILIPIIPPKSSCQNPIYLFMISPICRPAVDRQMVWDIVIMIRPALNVASMELSFLYKYEEKNKNLNPFIPVSAKTATSQVDLQVWKG